MKPKQSLSVLGSAFAVAFGINLALLLLISYLISHRSGPEIPTPKLQPVRFIDIASIETLKSKKIAEAPSGQTPAEKSPAMKPSNPAQKTSSERRPRPRKPQQQKTRPKSSPAKSEASSQAVSAPKIEVPAQGSGSPLANVPGTGERVTAPPGQWSLEKNENDDRAAANDETGEGGSGSSKLIVLSKVLPTYPRRAKAQGIQGWVRLDIRVDPTGRVSSAQVASAIPKGVFDRAALEAFRHWRFQPAFKEGRPVAQRAFLVIKFRLEQR
jgi:protein TonB